MPETRLILDIPRHWHDRLVLGRSMDSDFTQASQTNYNQLRDELRRRGVMYTNTEILDEWITRSPELFDTGYDRGLLGPELRVRTVAFTIPATTVNNNAD